MGVYSKRLELMRERSQAEVALQIPLPDEDSSEEGPLTPEHRVQNNDTVDLEASVEKPQLSMKENQEVRVTKDLKARGSIREYKVPSGVCGKVCSIEATGDALIAFDPADELLKVAKQDFDKLQVVSPTEGAASGSSAPSRIAATPTAARGVSPSAGEMEAASRPGTSASRQSKASSGRQLDLPSLLNATCSKANDS